MLSNLSPRCLNVTAKCLSPQIICSAVLVTYSSIFHAAAERRPQSGTACAIHIQGPQRGSGEPGVTSSSSFSSSPGRCSPQDRPGWKELRASYSLKVDSFAQLLNMSVRQEPGSQKLYQKHSSTFIRMFPLTKRSHTVCTEIDLLGA